MADISVGVEATSSGNNELVAATSGKRIRVKALLLVAATADVMYVTDGTTGTSIIGGSTTSISIGDNGGFVLPYNPAGWGETVPGETLELNLTTGNDVSGCLTYEIV